MYMSCDFFKSIRYDYFLVIVIIPLLLYCYTAIFCNAAQCLSLVAQSLNECDFASREELDAVLKQVATELGVSIRNFMLLCRLAITGVKVCCVVPISGYLHEFRTTKITSVKSRIVISTSEH